MAMTYEEAREMMQRARNGRRKLENNTYLIEQYAASVHEIWYAIRLHDTDVVTMHPDGSYTLDSGGWHTVTTKDRINRYAPVALYSVSRVWWVRPRWAGHAQHSENVNSVAVRFEDGMRVNCDGVRVAGTENDKEVSHV